MPLTLVEAAKMNSGDVIRSAIIEIYARSSDILMSLPFENIDGNAVKYNQEDTLPGIAFRGVNEGYTESTGVLNPVTEPLVIAGGDLDVDTAILKTMGEEIRSSQEAMKLKALSQKWTNTFIKGDSIANPKEFDGLQIRLGGDQLISNSGAGGGGPLSLVNLDALIDAVDDPTHLIMSKAMRRRLSAAARDTTVGGFISWEQDAFGRQQAFWGELPILIADRNSSAFKVLGFDEAATGGGASTATSIYCVSFREGMLTGIQNDAAEARDLGELQTKPSVRTRVEWLNGISLWHPRSAGRLRDISNAAVVK